MSAPDTFGGGGVGIGDGRRGGVGLRVGDRDLLRCHRLALASLARLLHELRLRVGAIAGLGVEIGRNGREVAHIVARGRRPLLGDEREGHRALDRLLPVGQHAPFLHLARALGDRIVDVLARIHHEVLKVRFDAGGDVGKGFAVGTAAGGAEAGEVVLGRAHVAREAQGARLEHHLEEGDVPAEPQLLAVAHVFGGDAVEARVELGVARLQVRHQASRCGTGRNRVTVCGLDGRKVGCRSRYRRPHDRKGGQASGKSDVHVRTPSNHAASLTLTLRRPAFISS